MTARPVTPPNFSIAPPNASPRAVRAGRWLLAFFVGFFLSDVLADQLAGARPLLDPQWIVAMPRLGLLVVSVLCARTMWQTGRRGVVPFLVVAGAAVQLFTPGMWRLRLQPERARTTARTALLAEEPLLSDGDDWSKLGVLDWDDDVVAWCVALQTQPAGATRAARTEALSKILIDAFEQRAFITYDTLTAVTDVGALTPDAAVALLANPRSRDEGESKPYPVIGAHEWLEDLPKENPGSGLNYATARAVLELFPDLEDLRPALDTSLRSKLPLPGTQDAVSSLRNALVLADLAGLTETASMLRERIGPTLRGAWLDHVDSRGREAGWTSCPEKNFGIVDAYETHLAIELLQRGGIPPGIDVNHLRVTASRRAVDIWYDRPEQILAAVDAELLDKTWPELVRPRFQASDALVVAFLGLILLSVLDILRQPLQPREDGPRPAHSPG